MKLNTKKWMIIPAVVILLILIGMMTNPSPKQFKDFVGEGGEFQVVIKRTSNWLIYSEYEVTKYKIFPLDWDTDQKHRDESSDQYWGFFNNFYKK